MGALFLRWRGSTATAISAILSEKADLHRSTAVVITLTPQFCHLLQKIILRNYFEITLEVEELKNTAIYPRAAGFATAAARWLYRGGIAPAWRLYFEVAKAV